MDTTIHNIKDILMGYASLKYSMGIYRFKYNKISHTLTFSGDGMLLFKATLLSEGTYKDLMGRFKILVFEDFSGEQPMSLYEIKKLIIKKLSYYNA